MGILSGGGVFFFLNVTLRFFLPSVQREYCFSFFFFSFFLSFSNCGLFLWLDGRWFIGPGGWGDEACSGMVMIDQRIEIEGSCGGSGTE